MNGIPVDSTIYGWLNRLTELEKRVAKLEAEAAGRREPARTTAA